MKNLKKIKINTKRDIIIYTWGIFNRKTCPYEFQQNFNLCSIIYRAHNLLKFRIKTGMDKEFQDNFLNNQKFKQYLFHIVETIENKNFSCISINCYYGIHRSVAMANILKKYFYPRAKIYHLELDIDVV